MDNFELSDIGEILGHCIILKDSGFKEVCLDVEDAIAIIGFAYKEMEKKENG